MLENHKMSGTANRYKFGQALDKTKDNCFEEIHLSYCTPHEVFCAMLVLCILRNYCRTTSNISKSKVDVQARQPRIIISILIDLSSLLEILMLQKLPRK